MTKVFKAIGLTLLLLILLVALSIGLLITCVSPNKFKPIIVAQVAKYTGRTLIIDGNLSWTFFPYLGISAGHMTLQNPEGFSNRVFAEISEAKVGVKFLPLLDKKIETSGIVLYGLKVNLIKSEVGTTNWVFVPAAPVVAAAELQSQTHDKYTVETAKGNAVSKPITVDVVIPSIDVKDSSVTWTDLQTKQTAVINHFNFHATNLNMSSPFDMQSSFDFDAKNPTSSGHVTFAANLQFNQAQQIVIAKNIDLKSQIKQPNTSFDLQVTGNLLANLQDQTVNMTNFKTIVNNLKDIKSPVEVTANAVANLQNNTAEVSNFAAKVANLNVKGSAAVTNLQTNPQIKGQLDASPFDVKAFLQALGKDNANLQVAKLSSATVDFTVMPNQALQGLTVQGKIKLSELQAAKIKSTDVDVNFLLQNGVLNLSTLDASLYNGFLKSQGKVLLMAPTPEISFNGKLGNVDAGALLKDLGQNQNNQIQLKGVANVDLQVTTAGLDADALTRNLNGTSHFSFVNGQLDGINIGNMIDKAYAVVKGQSAPAEAANTTNFGVLTGTATISKGVISNNDLYIDSPRFDTKGKGVIDLPNQHIDYLLETTMKKVGANHDDKQALNLYSLAIPIHVSGSLSHPSTSLDLASLAQGIAKMQMNQSKTQIQDKIKNEMTNKIKIKGKLGDQANKLINNLLGN